MMVPAVVIAVHHPLSQGSVPLDIFVALNVVPTTFEIVLLRHILFCLLICGEVHSLSLSPRHFACSAVLGNGCDSANVR